MVEAIDKIISLCKEAEGDWDWDTFTDLQSFRTDTTLLKCRRWIHDDTGTFSNRKLGLIIRLSTETLNALVYEPGAMHQIARHMVAHAKIVKEGAKYPEATVSLHRTYKVSLTYD